jgi:phosphonate degradation associated HDIG domain protein
MDKIVDELLGLYETAGETAYLRDVVSHTEHALQTAAQAVQAGAPDALVVAALLHDVGHLLPGVDETSLGASGADARHEARGAVFLARYFPIAVTRPIAMHVAAKRYLCAVDPAYAARLSPSSVRSLALQGGPLRDEAISAFERRAGFQEALSLRRWDEAAKVPGQTVPGLASYRPLIERCLAVGRLATDSSHDRRRTAIFGL